MSDLIDRQAAIDALGEKPLAWTDGEYELALQQQWESDIDAIKAVPSAQPTQNERVNSNNPLDCISRQAAIEAICKACSIEGDYHKCDGYPETSTWCDELVALRALPPTQPERKRGKWKYEGCDTYSCPFCGDTHVDDGDIYYFCKVCGADMRKNNA